jgi:hypothetical protein
MKIRQRSATVLRIGAVRGWLSAFFASTESKMEAKTKKPWHSPKVADYGHVAKLTAGSTGSHMDKGHESNQHGVG